MESFFLPKGLSFPLCPSPFLNPITEVSFVPGHWHLVASRRIIPSTGEREEESGGEPQSLQWGDECWVGVTASLPPSLCPCCGCPHGRAPAELPRARRNRGALGRLVCCSHAGLCFVPQFPCGKTRFSPRSPGLRWVRHNSKPSHYYSGGGKQYYSEPGLLITH